MLRIAGSALALVLTAAWTAGAQTVVSSDGWVTAPSEAVATVQYVASADQSCCAPVTTVASPVATAASQPPTLTSAPSSGCWNPCAPAPQTTAVAAYPAPVAPTTVFRPLIPLASAPSAYYIGQGILGQPKLYVPGQPVRNLLRYVTP